MNVYAPFTQPLCHPPFMLDRLCRTGACCVIHHDEEARQTIVGRAVPANPVVTDQVDIGEPRCPPLIIAVKLCVP